MCIQKGSTLGTIISIVYYDKTTLRDLTFQLSIPDNKNSFTIHIKAIDQDRPHDAIGDEDEVFDLSEKLEEQILTFSYTLPKTYYTISTQPFTIESDGAKDGSEADYDAIARVTVKIGPPVTPL